MVGSIFCWAVWADDFSRYKTHGKHMEEYAAKIRSNPDDTDSLMELAKRYGWEKDLANAVLTYEKVLAVDPGHLEAHRKLADFYGWTGRTADSAKALEFVVHKEPQNREAKAKLGERYARLKRYDDADRIYRELLADDPQDLTAKKGLAAVKSIRADHRGAVQDYLSLIPQSSREERLDLYDRVGDSYYASRAFGEARDYYEQILKEDPANEDARKRLTQIAERLKPRIFTEYRHQQFKAESDRVLYEVGYDQPLNFDTTLTGIYEYYRNLEGGQERHRYDAFRLQATHRVDDNTSFTIGGVGKFYNTDKARFDYDLKLRKKFKDNFRMDFGYEKRTEDMDLDRLFQKVDRHELSTTLYYDYNEFFSLQAYAEGRYYTKGKAPSDNGRLAGYIQPIFHVRRNPDLDLSYQYYRIYSFEKDRNRIESYEYFAPRKFEQHSLQARFAHRFNDRLQIDVGDVLGWVHEDGAWYLQNTIISEVTYRITDADRVSAGFLYSRDIHDSITDEYKNEEWWVRFSHRF
jgi:tetratricopeptide (TPR) repeat protein